jgi:8-oxo-dGTP pyrophosphatase MutT (NUDIX family)
VSPGQDSCRPVPARAAPATAGRPYALGVAILIDPPRPEAHGRRWSHLVSDTSLDELHHFARSVGIPERGFEGDHYDIPEERYASVVAAGALPTPARDLLRALQASGLRMQKRRGDKGVARVRGIRFADGTTADVDLIRSDREADEARVFAAMAFVQDDVGDFAVVYSVRRAQWGSPGGWRESRESVRENAVREVREETGLVVDEGALEPRGYERFHGRSAGGLWQEGRDLIQVYEVRVPGRRPPLTAELDDTSDRRWMTWAELERECADQFWWPLAVAVLSPRAG